MTPPNKYNPNIRIENIYFEDAKELNEPIIVNNAFEKEWIFRNMHRVYNEKHLHYDLVLRANLLILLEYLTTHTNSNFKRSKTVELVDQLTDFIYMNLHLPLDNAQIAAQFNYHPNYLNRVLLNATGYSLHQYLIICRINHATLLLSSTDEPISRIAHASGYSSAYYFSTAFRSVMGLSPSEYRKYTSVPAKKPIDKFVF
ncbi:MAG: helix-turn-helix transcriptional regulator [Christensenellales bacterium]|jgi:AraC-like DNA-binding protein